MAPATKHKDPDHAYIVARQERYIEAWRSGSQERVMEFMDKDNFNFSDFSQYDLSGSANDASYLLSTNIA